jgi:hypothetical protein
VRKVAQNPSNSVSYSYEEYIGVLYEDEFIVEEYEPSEPRIFNQRMFECIDKLTHGEWNFAVQKWFRQQEEVLLMKTYMRDEVTRLGYCANHLEDRSRLHVEIGIIDIDKFIKLVKSSKSYCKVCKLILFTVVETDDMIVTSLS